MCLGLTYCEIPLLDDIKEEPGVYSIRLGFMAQSGDRDGQRVFNIMLQGKPVLENFDIIKTAGAPNIPVIKEFTGIIVENVLMLRLIPKSENPSIDQAPIINFIEVIRSDCPKITSVSRQSKNI